MKIRAGLDWPTWDALVAYAKTQERDPEAQIRVMIRTELQRLGFLPNNAVHLTPAAGRSRDDNDTEPQAQVTADR